MPATRQGTTYNNGNMPGKGRRNRNRQSNPSSRTSSESEGIDRANTGNVTPATPSTSQAGSSTAAATMTSRPVVKTEPGIPDRYLDIIENMGRQMQEMQVRCEQLEQNQRPDRMTQHYNNPSEDINTLRKISKSISFYDSTKDPRLWFSTVERVARMSNMDPMKLAMLRSPPEIQNRIEFASNWQEAKNEICMSTGLPPDEIVNLAGIKQKEGECFYEFFNRSRDLTKTRHFSVTELITFANNLRDAPLRAEALAMITYKRPSPHEFAQEMLRREAVLNFGKDPTGTPAVNNVGRFSRRDNFDNNRYGNNRSFNRSHSRGQDGNRQDYRNNSRGRFNNRDSSQGRNNSYNGGQHNGYNSGQQNSYNGGQQNNYNGSQQANYGRDGSNSRQNNYNRDNSRGRQGNYSRDSSRNRQDHNRYGTNQDSSTNNQSSFIPTESEWRKMAEKQDLIMKAIAELKADKNSLN